jgi:hypothetical protein
LPLLSSWQIIKEMAAKSAIFITLLSVAVPAVSGEGQIFQEVFAGGKFKSVGDNVHFVKIRLLSIVCICKYPSTITNVEQQVGKW